MTESTAAELLRRAESYLSALHGSVARHDNLGANLGCAGCELRDRIAAALAAPAEPVGQEKDRCSHDIETALGTYPCERDAGHLGDCDERTDAEIAAAEAPPTLDLPAAAVRAAVLREAADKLGRMDYDTDSNDYGYDTYRDAWNGGVMDGADLLRRFAGEAPEGKETA